MFKIYRFLLPSSIIIPASTLVSTTSSLIIVYVKASSKDAFWFEVNGRLKAGLDDSLLFSLATIRTVFFAAESLSHTCYLRMYPTQETP